MKKIALVLTSLILAAPMVAPSAAASDAPAFHRSYESGIQVYRGHVPQINLQPILELQARERQAAAARAQAERLELARIRSSERQAAQFAALQAQIARSQRPVIINDNGRRRGDFLFNGLFALDNGFIGRRGYGARGFRSQGQGSGLRASGLQGSRLQGSRLQGSKLGGSRY